MREHADDGGAGRLLTEKFEHFVALVERGIVQATEKLLSLFEEHTQIITRHKAAKSPGSTGVKF